MFESLRRRFRRVELRPMSLRFTMDRTEDNHHRVQVFRVVEGYEELVTDVEVLSRYGYREEVVTSDRTCHLLRG